MKSDYILLGTILILCGFLGLFAIKSLFAGAIGVGIAKIIIGLVEKD